MPLPDPLLNPTEYNSLPSEERRAKLADYFEEQRTSGNVDLQDKPTSGLVESAEGLLTAQRFQQIPVIGSAFEKASQLRGAIGEGVSKVAKFAGLPEGAADWAGGIASSLAVDLPAGAIAAAATGFLTENPVSPVFAANATIGMLEAGQELVTTGRKDTAAVTLLGSLALTPAGRIGVKASRLLGGAEEATEAAGRVFVEGASKGNPSAIATANRISRSILENMTPVNRRELMVKHAAELAVNLPTMAYGKDLDKEGGAILGTALAFQAVSAYGDIKSSTQLKWRAELQDKIKVQMQEEAATRAKELIQVKNNEDANLEMERQRLLKEESNPVLKAAAEHNRRVNEAARGNVTGDPVSDNRATFQAVDAFHAMMNEVEGPRAGVSEIELHTSNDPALKAQSLLGDVAKKAEENLDTATPGDVTMFPNSSDVQTPIKKAASMDELLVTMNQRAKSKASPATKEITESLGEKVPEPVSTVETKAPMQRGKRTPYTKDPTPEEAAIAAEAAKKSDQAHVDKVKELLGENMEQGYRSLRETTSKIVATKGIAETDALHDQVVDQVMREAIDNFKIKKKGDNIQALEGNINRLASQRVIDARRNGSRVSSLETTPEAELVKAEPGPIFSSISEKGQTLLSDTVERIAQHQQLQAASQSRVLDAAERKRILSPDQLSSEYKQLGIIIRTGLSESDRAKLIEKLSEGLADREANVLKNTLGLSDLNFRRMKDSAEDKAGLYEAFDAHAIEYATKRFKYEVKTWTPEEIKRAYPTSPSDAIGLRDAANRRIVISSEATPAQRIKTIFHELGHITFDPNKAADLLGTYSRGDVARLMREFDVSTEYALAKELHAEAFSYLVDHEFNRINAPLLKQVMYSTANFLEWAGIPSLKAAKDKGFAATFRISRETANLIGSVREAALYLAGRDPGVSRVFSKNVDEINYSRVIVPTKDSKWDELYAKPKGKPSSMFTRNWTDRFAPLKTLHDVYDMASKLGVKITPKDMVDVIQRMTGRAAGTAERVLTDPEHGNVHQIALELQKHPDGDLTEAYSKWRDAKRYQHLLTRKGVEVEGEGMVNKPISPWIDKRGNKYTFEDASARISEIEKQVGSATVQLFENYSKREQMFYNYWLKAQAEAGLISGKLADAKTDDPHYTPFYYLKELRARVGGKEVFDAPPTEYMMEAIEGGVKEPHLGLDTLARAGTYAARMSTAIETNKVLRKVKYFSHISNQLQAALSELPADQAKMLGPKYEGAVQAINSLVRSGKDSDSFQGMAARHYFEGGIRKTMFVAEDIAASMDHMTEHDSNWLTNIASVPSTLVRYLATAASPTFALGNPLRDIPNALIMAPEGLKAGDFFKNYMGSLWETMQYVYSRKLSPNYLKQFKDISDLRSLGGTSGIMLEESRGMLHKFRKSMLPHFVQPSESPSLVPSMGARIKNLFEAPSEITEIATRLAIYKALKEKVGTERAAAASRSILDYERGGLIARQINQVVPFFNARVQGADVLTRSLLALKDPKATSQQRIVAGMNLLVRGAIISGTMSTIQMVYAATANKTDEALRANENQWSKYFMFPISTTNHVTGEKSVSYVTFPKSEVHQMLFNPIEAMFRDTIKKAGFVQGGKDVFKALLNSFSPINPVDSFTSMGANAMATIAQGFGPVGNTIAQQLANKDFFTGRDIVSQGQKNWNPEDQYNSSTLKISRLVGSLAGTSPAKIESAAKSLGVGGDFLRLMKVTDLMLPDVGALPPEKKTAISKLEASPFSAAFVKEGGFTDPLSEVQQGDVYKQVNSTVQSDNAKFRRQLQSATNAAAAGDMEPLHELQRMYRGRSEWVNQIKDIQKNIGSEYNQTVTELKSWPTPMRAAALIQMTQDMDQSQRTQFLNTMRRRNVMTDDTSAYYRRFDKAIKSGMSPEEFGDIIQKAYLKSGKLPSPASN